MWVCELWLNVVVFFRGLFGNIQTTAHNQPTAQSTSLFSFGQQHPQSAPKPFEPPASLMSPPSSFHFGGATSNGGSGFVFGSTAPPTNFAFGAQQPAVSKFLFLKWRSGSISAGFYLLHFLKSVYVKNFSRNILAQRYLANHWWFEFSWHFLEFWNFFL